MLELWLFLKLRHKCLQVFIEILCYDLVIAQLATEGKVAIYHHLLFFYLLQKRVVGKVLALLTVEEDENLIKSELND